MANTRVYKICLRSDLERSVGFRAAVGDKKVDERKGINSLLFRSLLNMFNGQLSRDDGDGKIAMFDHASESVEFALMYQKFLSDFGVFGNNRMRVAIHCGELTDGPDGYDGGPLEVLARMLGATVPGQVLVSQQVRDDTHSTLGETWWGAKVIWVPHGRLRFKGDEHPRDLFEVGIDGLSPFQRHAEPDKGSWVP